MIAACVLLLTSALHATLQPDQLLLIANRQMPEGVALAEYYARVRGVPEGRLLVLDIPTGEQMDSGVYHQSIKPRIRAFLEEHGLTDKVECIVTFHGVPIRIGARTTTPAERNELAEVDRLQKRVDERLTQAVDRIELAAIACDPAFRSSRATGSIELLRRIEAAQATIQRAIQARPALANEPVVANLHEIVPLLTQPLNALVGERAPMPENATPAQQRAYVRQIGPTTIPAAQLAQLLEAQRLQLSDAETQASFDSELSMIHFPEYPLHRWQLNPMHHSARVAPNAPKLVMTSRLDGPDAGTVRRMIDQAIAVEKTGLQGLIAIDSRGIAEKRPDGATDGYGWYDQALRNLADLLRRHPQIKLVHDNQEAVFAPNSLDGIAVYVGWYSVENYIPPGRFVEGAVGFHVASFEMKTLREVNNRGWVRGLLKDGVIATLGPVSEPYLHAFPRADEFFPLLLTGELTWAECYWRTNLLTSWQIGLIGDPLYRPFAANPLLKRDDLPPNLRAVLPAR